MTTLTVAAVLALATTCQNVVAPTTILKIAQHESGMDPSARHVNRDGSIDVGLMQINNKNFAYLALADPMDPCESIAAAARLLKSFSLYNTGSPSKGISNGYAVAVQAMHLSDGAHNTIAPPIDMSAAYNSFNDEPSTQSPFNNGE